MEVDRRGAVDPITWETTRVEPSLDVERGTVTIGERGAPAIATAASESPAIIQRLASNEHECVGLSDGHAGVTVLCRFSERATRVAGTNVTGGEPLTGVWTAAGRHRVARLDLPLDRRGAEARVIGYVAGVKGVVVRAEASWLEGEAQPSLALFEAER